ncbi:MAG: hypothetical protein U9P44_02995 [archaeon]|nr:hypothetical protein [archaeon]
MGEEIKETDYEIPDKEKVHRIIDEIVPNWVGPVIESCSGGGLIVYGVATSITPVAIIGIPLYADGIYRLGKRNMIKKHMDYLKKYFFQDNAPDNTPNDIYS